MDGEDWLDSLARHGSTERTSHRTERYQMADGILEVEGDADGFQERFCSLFEECRINGESPGQPALNCAVRPSADSVWISIDDPDPVDVIAFLIALHPERSYRESDTTPAGWRCLLDDLGQPVLATRDGRYAVPKGTAWQALVGNLFVNLLLRRQPHMLFLHAASIAIGGRGMLLLGEKGAGKSTLSLGLASRGHEFLGDEIAACDSRTWRLLPFRRSASLRRGPQASAVATQIEREPVREEIFPDGTPRLRFPVRDLFPQSGSAPTPLDDVFFLKPFTERPRVERVAAGRDQVRHLEALPVTMWGDTAPRRLFQLLQLLSRSRCFALHPGAPDATVALIEETVASA